MEKPNLEVDEDYIIHYLYSIQLFLHCMALVWV